MRHDDPAAEFGCWAVQAPSEGFSARTALLCRGQAPPLKLRGFPRVLFRVLLAALMLSAGAYAASQYARGTLSTDSESANSEPHHFEVGKVAVYTAPRADGFAEREKGEDLRVKRKPMRTQPVVQESSEEAIGEPSKPPGVHHPRCYCGTSAVVCFCSD
jgi:hypothetical protein